MLSTGDDKVVIAAGYCKGDEGRNVGESKAVIDQISLRKQDVADGELNDLVDNPVLLLHGICRPYGVEIVRFRKIIEEIAR